MTAYLLRRAAYAVPILIGVNLLTFVLFFVVSTPEHMARAHNPGKNVRQETLDTWIHEHGYDRPRLWNPAASGAGKVTETLFFDRCVRLFALDFGRSDDDREIWSDIRRRAGPSLAIAVPTFLLGILVDITVALFVVLFRATYLDVWGVVAAVLLMSISLLFYVIGGQYLFSKILRLVPVSGYGDGLDAGRFVVLPVLIGIVSGVGLGVRLYRTFFLEEIGKDYVRTARAKGLPETRVLFAHVLKSALIPILTGAVVAIPLLFMGSLIEESFFGIPGLGSYTIDAIHAQDFAVVRAMVFLGSILYMIGLVATDVAYTLVDPRVRLS